MARGGKPMPNSCTVTPARRATTKWPNSWMTTRTTRMASRITTSRKPFPIPVSSSGITASRRLDRLGGFGPGADVRVEGDQLVEIRSLDFVCSEARNGIATQLRNAVERDGAVQKSIHCHVIRGYESSACARPLAACLTPYRQRWKPRIVDRLK